MQRLFPFRESSHDITDHQDHSGYYFRKIPSGSSCKRYPVAGGIGYFDF